MKKGRMTRGWNSALMFLQYSDAAVWLTERANSLKLECGPMPNMMAALPLLRSSADIGERKTHTHNRFMAFSGTTRVTRCQKRTSGLYGARED